MKSITNTSFFFSYKILKKFINKQAEKLNNVFDNAEIYTCKHTEHLNSFSESLLPVPVSGRINCPEIPEK